MAYIVKNTKDSNRITTATYFIYALLSNAASASYISSDEGRLVHNKLQRLWKEAVAA
jgi:hypothetical protein